MPSDTLPRAHLRTEPVPAGAAPMVVTVARVFGGGEMTLSYVPDRDLLVAASLQPYLASFPAAAPEALAAKIAEDLANELVPRWHRVSVVVPGHIATVEDRQPGWDHPTLLTAVSPPRMPQ